ncbi:hypothetical protein LPJ64_000997 [Coemansia asiatica]|uniref:Uncharacterized protein n=1 Tax=Coemansia asiatica TaxID=1052880 RepID=A0A9W8CMG6_9FUNG|nr:hypothetical protein LPJ64_000997 [Coemansia asiatica]
MPLYSETPDAVSQPSLPNRRETMTESEDSNGGNKSNSNIDAHQNTTATVQHLSDMLRSTELNWQSCPSDSGSDTVDTVRIVKSSGLLRNRLAHYYYHDRVSGGGLSDLSSVEEFDDADSPDLGIELELLQQKDNSDLSSEPCNTEAGNVGSLSVKHADALRWCPQFLSETNVANMSSEIRQLTSETVIRTDDIVQDLSHFSDLEHHRHYYPLRQRSEKNLHPYTKLVWTNPKDLLDSANRRRDISLLYDLSKREVSARNDMQEMDVQEDSEDEEYVPGMTEAVEQESQIMDFYMDSVGDDPGLSQILDDLSPSKNLRKSLAVAPLSARAHKEGLTYKHLAARRRQAKTSDHRREDRSGSFPSVEALLAGRSASQFDSTTENVRRQDDGDDDDPSSIIEVKAQQPNARQKHSLHDVQQGVKLSGSESHAATPTGSRRRRLLSRRRNIDHSDVSNDDESLPTAKARKLNKISRRHIRGVLPFSFMRGFDREKQTEIQEEVKRWQHRKEERPRMHRVLSSSPRPDMAMEGDSDSIDRALNHNRNRGFSEIKDASEANDALALSKRQPLFEFNFLDIYKWSYPEHAPIEQTGHAPDFLRIAARECRRRADTLETDDPWRKHIRIALRAKHELEDEDMAQSILGAWRLGIMDVRRVYFCDDEQDTTEDDLEEEQKLDSTMYLEQGCRDSCNEQGDPAIVISDDEAAEDNSLLDVSGRGLLIGSGRSARGPRYQRRLNRGSKRVSGKSRLYPLPMMPYGDRYSTGPLHRHRQTVHKETPAANGIRAVIGEFAAFDSDHESDKSKGDRMTKDHRSLGYPNASFMKLPPTEAAIGQHASQRRRDEVKRQEFVQRFNRWQPTSASGLDASRSRAYSNRKPGGHRSRYALQSSGAPVRQAEFLFDEDPVLKEPHSSGSLVARAHVQRKKQTRIIAKQQSSKSGLVALNAVAERIGRAASRKQMPLTRKKPGNNASSFRSAPRKTAQPTRVQLRLATGAADREQQEQLGIPSFVGEEEGDEPELPFGLLSGMRFHSDSWIGQGGIQRMQRLLHHQLQTETHDMGAEADVFDYNDILSISIDATVDEFCQAFDMLCMVWRESSATDAVLRWMEFSQLFVFRRSKQPKDLAAITKGILGCTHAQLPTSDAPVALVLGVTLMQLSREIQNWRLYETERRGAVGYECEELEAWSVERLAKEIDNCVLVAAGLLPLKTDITFLGFEAQIVVALLHALRTGSEFVPLAPVEDAALRACASSKHIGAYWRALARLATLAQINQDGVAAPRPAAQWHRALGSLVEVAVDKDLRPGLGDAGVRQVFVRVHRLVSLGLRVAPTSRLHVLLFRFLEARKFASLGIEPAPALPRFFTRYSGTIPMQGGLDTCTVLWLRALDAAFADWAGQLDEPGASKILRGMRVLVSKLLPTRILTVDSSQGLAALANYYAVVLFFLHAVPRVVVRPARLYSQLQALLRFRESASFTARRVYFEAWSAAASILGLHQRLALEKSGSRDVDKLVSCSNGSSTEAIDTEYFAAQGVDASVADYFLALSAAVSGWADAVDVVLAEKSADAWRLADAALAYAVRVLQSAVLAGHAPTVLLLILKLLQTRPMTGIVAAAMSSSAANAVGSDTRFSILGRMRAIVDIWQQTVAARDTPGSAAAKTASGVACTDAEAAAKAAGADGMLSCSQSEFGFIDSSDLLAVAAEAEELERQAAFAPVDRAILQTIHGNFIPDIRRTIISRFSTLGPSPRIDKRGLDTVVLMLTEMVAICVDAGIRTWESFLDEYGRDSLYLIPDTEGRRHVLVVFAVCAVDILRRKDKSAGALEHLIKDIWFASICDIRLSGHVQRLTALLHWCDSHGSETPVFDMVPISSNLLVDQRGMLKHSIGQRSAVDDFAPEEAAAVTVAFVDCVLQKIVALASSEHCSAGLTHLFCSWINRLVSAQNQIRESFSGASLRASDDWQLIDAMSERILALVRAHCAELLPINT